MGSSAPAPAQEGRSFGILNRPAPHVRIHAINIYVRDQDRSLRFYLDQLGFDLAFDAELQSGDRWVAVAPPDGSAVLALIAPKPESKEFKLIGRPTGIVLVTDNLVAKYSEWSKRGVRFRYAPRLRRVKYQSPSAAITDHDRIWGGIFTHFVDVDGNSFALVGFDEVTREIEEQRRTMEEKREAERRAAHELDIAKQVQARLFPQNLPPMRTLEYAGVCMQARQVGGDYYDFLNLGESRLGLVIGDISGKGIAAALLMANLQANLRSQCAVALNQPERLLRTVNQVFRDNTTESAYATLFFGEYDDESRRLQYVNCGHLPALLLRADDSVERLESTATVVGLFEDWDCSIGKRQLFPGDVLAVYTDGVTESFADNGEDFGEHRLIDVLRRNRRSSPENLIASVLDAVQKFSPREQHDDITVTIAKCR